MSRYNHAQRLLLFPVAAYTTTSLITTCPINYAQIASALSYLHGGVDADNASFVHRDIKPENVLLTVALVAKLTDFGLAVTKSNSASRSTTIGQAGTLTYVPHLAPLPFLVYPLCGPHWRTLVVAPSLTQLPWHVANRVTRGVPPYPAHGSEGPYMSIPLSRGREGGQ